MIDGLLTGQTLVILNDEMRTDKERLYNYMHTNHVTYLSGTPSVLSMYEYTGLNCLKRIDAVGEDFTPSLFSKIRHTFNGLIINGYGPTEVSITTHKRLYPGDALALTRARPPTRTRERINKSIGHQISNTTCFVLNTRSGMKRVPIGGIGELYLGGIGVARGYLNRPDLTSQSFIHGENGERLYKTGDLVRFLRNGELEYLGRNDLQVKVRGLRIELSEIEGVLLTYPKITGAVVIQNKTTKFIIGYYVTTAASACDLEEQDIKRYLQTKLPEYMMPTRLVRIDQIHVTISGKIDTKQLPLVEFLSNDDFVEPQSEVEIKMCHIWSELLHIPVSHVGIHDDFFSLGGDSLLVITLSFMITKDFGRRISVPQILANKTVGALSRLILLDNSDKKLEDDDDAILNLNQNQNHVLSLSQERLIFIDEMENGTDAFNIHFDIKIPAEIDQDRLAESIVCVVKRHEVLRTLLPRGRMHMRILKEDEVDDYFRINHVTVKDEAEIAQARKYIFNLDKELPIRVTIFEIPGKITIMTIVFHHVCFDGISWGIFQKDLKAFYDFGPSSSSLSPLKVHYKEFAVWQRKLLKNKSKLDKLKNYWVEYLKGHEQLNLLPDFSRPTQFDYSGKTMDFNLKTEVMDELKKLARNLKVSLFSVLVSAYCLTLSVYSNQRKIMIGTPVTNRNRAEFENVIGFFVNLVVLNMDVNPSIPISEYIQKVGEDVVKSYVHQDMSFEQLVNLIGVDKDLSRHPLVQVIFSFNPHTQQEMALGSPYTFNQSEDNACVDTPSKYDLSVAMSDNGAGSITWASKLFRQSTAENILKTFKNILNELSGLIGNGKMDGMKIRDVKVVDETQSLEILRLSTSPGSKTALPHLNTTLNKIFEDVAKNSWDKPALVYKNLELSYGELNMRGNQLARYLKSLTQDDIKPDDLIGLLLDKNELMILSILGVWKCGAAYVPIDPSFPNDRIQFILKDTQAKILITNQRYAQRLAEFIENDVTIVEIDSCVTTEGLNSQPTENFKTDVNPSNLAYIIYTSGTTGQPKGVMVEHKSVVNFRHGLISYHSHSHSPEPKNVLFLSNYVFDFSIEQLILSILNPSIPSSKLIIPTNLTLDLDDEFYDYLNLHKLNYLSGTPTFIHEMDLSRLTHLETCTVAGEALTQAVYDKIRSEFHGRIVNAYGVTETTVYNIVTSMDAYKNSLDVILPNMAKYVLNENLQLLPLGAVGELYLSGECVARGYLNRPDLNTASFLEWEGSRIYKTGDLVRHLPDGGLEYIGRNDSQVKIRGLRVEVGEIESAILELHPGIKKCAVIVVAKRQLVGYYVSMSDTHIIEEEILKSLEIKLPNYMIPTRLIKIERKSLPMTINGKLDTTALLKMDNVKGVRTKESDRCFVPPRNNIENQLSQIWSTLLGIERDVGTGPAFAYLPPRANLTERPTITRK